MTNGLQIEVTDTKYATVIPIVVCLCQVCGLLPGWLGWSCGLREKSRVNWCFLILTVCEYLVFQRRFDGIILSVDPGHPVNTS